MLKQVARILSVLHEEFGEFEKNSNVGNATKKIQPAELKLGANKEKWHDNLLNAHLQRHQLRPCSED
jgi:hypothetical protein